MAQVHGRCVWCGGTGLTKGHIWPEWFGKVLPLNAQSHLQLVGDYQTFIPQHARPAFQQQVRQGHAGSRKPRNTCKSCNGGWMSRLEKAAMFGATPLLLGQRTLLTTLDQRLLATLLCLINIRVEYTDLSTKAVPDSDRHWLMTKGEPPDSWRIWIARYVGNRSEEHWCRHHGIDIVSSPDENAGPYKCNTQVTTLVMGQLCAHLFSSTVWDDFIGYEGVNLTRIWPPRQLDIDTTFMAGLNDSTLVSLAEALIRETPPAPTK